MDSSAYWIRPRALKDRSRTGRGPASAASDGPLIQEKAHPPAALKRCGTRHVDQKNHPSDRPGIL